MKQLFRIERDSLGEVQVPACAYYGIQTRRAMIHFSISGKKPYPAFIWSMALIKRAAADVNAELSLLDPTIGAAISAAANEIMNGMLWDQFTVDPFQAGAGTSHNMNTNEVIANRATEILGGKVGEYLVHPYDHVNMAQSTNDTIPTAIRLGCLWRHGELIEMVSKLVTALTHKAIQFDDVIKSGRTHLQDATPVRLGQEFGAYARAIDRDMARISHAGEGLRRLGIGGTAVGSGLNAHPGFHLLMVDRISEITGWELLASDNLFESMQSMADMVDYSAAMRTLALTLIRVANDLRLLASGPAAGFYEISLPAVQHGSSIMPGKVNPVMAEMLDMAMFQVIGCDTTIAYASQAGQLELNVMMPVIAHNLFESMQIMIGAINAFTEFCVMGIQANENNNQKWLSRNAMIITVLNPLIGYSTGAALVAEAHERDIPIVEVAREWCKEKKLISGATGQPLSEDEVVSALSDLRRLTEGGLVGG